MWAGHCVWGPGLQVSRWRLVWGKVTGIVRLWPDRRLRVVLWVVWGFLRNHLLTARWGRGAGPVLSPALGFQSLTQPIRGPTSKGKLLQCRCVVPAPGLLVQQVWSRAQEVSFLTYVQQHTQKYRSTSVSSPPGREDTHSSNKALPSFPALWHPASICPHDHLVRCSGPSLLLILQLREQRQQRLIKERRSCHSTWGTHTSPHLPVCFPRGHRPQESCLCALDATSWQSAPRPTSEPPCLERGATWAPQDVLSSTGMILQTLQRSHLILNVPPLQLPQHSVQLLNFIKLWK